MDIVGLEKWSRVNIHFIDRDRDPVEDATVIKVFHNLQQIQVRGVWRYGREGEYLIPFTSILVIERAGKLEEGEIGKG